MMSKALRVSILFVLVLSLAFTAALPATPQGDNVL